MTANSAGRIGPGFLPAGLVAIGVVLLVATGVEVGQAVRLVAVVAIQGCTGALWWSLTRRRGPVPAMEALGMGLALGTLGALLAAQLLRTTPVGGVGWLAPTVLAVLVWVVTGRPNPRIEPAGRRDLAGLGVASAVGLLTLVPFWRSYPLTWTGWRHVNLDLMYQESLVRSLAGFGPGDNILAAGHRLGYHWFTHAWAGSLADTVRADSFVTITRVVPLVALLGSTAVAMAWSQRLSKVVWVPGTAALLVAATGFVGTSAGRGGLLPPLSPSLGFSLPWLLAGSLLVTEHLAGRIGRRGIAVLALLAAGCVGGKVTNGAALLAGIAGIGLATAGREAALAWRVMRLGLAAGVGVLLAYLLVVAGSSHRLSPGMAGSTAGHLGLEPVDGTVGFALGSLSLILAMTARWIGFAGVLANRERRREPFVAYSVAVALVGLLGTVSLTHVANSQIFFVLSASAVLSVSAAVGLGDLAAHEVVRGVAGRLLVVVGLGAAALGSAMHVAGAGGLLGWAAPLAVWLLVGGAAVLVTWRGDGTSRRRVFRLVAVGLVVAAIGSTGAGTVQELVRNTGPADPYDDFAWTEDHRAAAAWLEEAADERDIVATNRLCTDPAETPPECSSRWFLTSALGGRRMFVEGYDYGVGLDGLPDWATRRIAQSVAFADHPDRVAAAALWNAGVRWVWVDPTLTTTRSWAPYAQVAFRNDLVTILRLLPIGT